ncbi:DUF3102 domain-containing protein, partial [Planctomycetota bacterium]
MSDGEMILAPDRLPALPEWSAPSSLDDAAATITRLGRNIHEYAYIIGKTLAWVKGKVGHGNFLPWLEANVWFAERTAQKFMAFARQCAGEDALLDYTTPKSAPHADLPADDDPDPDPIIPEVEEGEESHGGDSMPAPVSVAVARIPGQVLVEELEAVAKALGDLKPHVERAAGRIARARAKWGLADVTV